MNLIAVFLNKYICDFIFAYHVSFISQCILSYCILCKIFLSHGITIALITIL